MVSSNTFVEAACGSWPFLSIEGQIVQLKSPAIQIKAVASKVFTESRSVEKKIFLSMGSLGAYTFRITIFKCCKETLLIGGITPYLRLIVHFVMKAPNLAQT